MINNAIVNTLIHGECLVYYLLRISAPKLDFCGALKSLLTEHREVYCHFMSV